MKLYQILGTAAAVFAFLFVFRLLENGWVFQTWLNLVSTAGFSIAFLISRAESLR
jgi:hypothetical protein